MTRETGMNSGASRLSSGLILFLALSVLSTVGCKGCDKKDDQVAVTTAAPVEQSKYSSGLPPAPPQPVEITPIRRLTSRLFITVYRWKNCFA